MQSDIENFTQYKFSMNEDLAGGNLRPAFSIGNRYLEAAKKQVRYMQSVLASSPKFEGQIGNSETVSVPPKMANWPVNNLERENRWNLILQSYAETIKNNGAENGTVNSILVGELVRDKSRLESFTGEDIFNIYMNSVAKSFDSHSAYISPESSQLVDENLYTTINEKPYELGSASKRTLIASGVVTGHVSQVASGGRSYKVGVISIPSFYFDPYDIDDGNSVTKDVRQALLDLSKQGIEGLILDLRGNPGGALAQAVRVSGMFIGDNPVVTVRDSRNRQETQKSLNNKKVEKNLPLVVLVDRVSAGASEIFAGAMQDYGRAIIVGGQTFGLGTAQAIQPLNYGELKVTVAQYYRVSGEGFQKKGITPDIQFPNAYDQYELGEEALSNPLPWNSTKAALYSPVMNVNAYLERLNEGHKKRVADNPVFTQKDYFQQYKYLPPHSDEFLKEGEMILADLIRLSGE
ncbi:carboxy terminal-processing peptidase [Sansalvadorimonas sp. 2012CJ34-2]|uniref:Carboxy terminal-processing peptidase n=1 Tax=Parendozoicomonas callyspongiae TaxID=2942213 RepID=A0ABT0PK68_9GAMM|nr:carboxy terminal-processing peptidase [Sansalvadorimonas sp. 2012CJ34-2]